MPLEVLNKPGKLDDAEFRLIQSHPERGHELLVRAGQQSPTVLDVCLHHHEKIDGSGYPHRLSGEQISLAARMGAVCDVYDAITSNRPYKRGWDPAESIARMAEWRRRATSTRRSSRPSSRASASIRPVRWCGCSPGAWPWSSAEPGDPDRTGRQAFFSTRSQMPISPS